MKVENKILTSFALAFLAVLFVGTLLYANNRALTRHNASVIHTYEVLETIDALFDAARDIETGARGFLLTGREEFLEPFHAGMGSIEGKTAEMREKVSDSPTQVANLAILSELLQRKAAISQEQIAYRRTHSLDETVAILTGRGKQSMDAVRTHIAKMRGVERALLDQRFRESAISARNVNFTFLALMVASGLLLAIFFYQVSGDLAERQRIAARLAANEAQFRGVLESAPDAMVLSDGAGRITMTNPAFSRLFGIAESDALGRPLTDFLRARHESASRSDETSLGETSDSAGDPAGPLDSRLESAIAASRNSDGAMSGLRQREARLAPTRFEGVRAAGGEPFPVEISESALSAEANSESVTITAIRDRTEREQAERDLRGFSEELARSNAELERFAYVASHDLQEPLRMVSSYTQLLKRRYREKLDTSANEFIDFAVDGANRMQKLIQDLLSYSRVGSRPLELAPVDCEGVLERVLRDMQETLEERGATVEHEPLPLVRGDAGQLGQLFQNLLANATKFVRPNVPPRVQISVTARGKKFWEFAFQDNGIGIDPQYFERIFIIFQRLHGKDAYPGTGIGLAICKKIVERHGGRLWVESKPDVGAKFLFTLPVLDV